MVIMLFSSALICASLRKEIEKENKQTNSLQILQHHSEDLQKRFLWLILNEDLKQNRTIKADR